MSFTFQYLKYVEYSLEHKMDLVLSDAYYSLLYS